MSRKFNFRLFLITLLILILLCLLAITIFRPVLSNYAISTLSKYTKGQYVCTLDDEGMHVGQLYKINKGQKELLKTYYRTEKTLVAYFKKHLMWYVKSMPCATATKLKILEFSTLKEIEDLIETL